MRIPSLCHRTLLVGLAATRTARRTRTSMSTKRHSRGSKSESLLAEKSKLSHAVRRMKGVSGLPGSRKKECDGGGRFQIESHLVHSLCRYNGLRFAFTQRQNGSQRPAL